VLAFALTPAATAWPALITVSVSQRTNLRRPNPANVRSGPIADKREYGLIVRFVPIADIAAVNLTMHPGISDDGITSPFPVVIYL